MEGPDASEHSEAEKQNRKAQICRPSCSWNCASWCQVNEPALALNREDADEHERASEERIERQLHRPVSLFVEPQVAIRKYFGTITSS